MKIAFLEDGIYAYASNSSYAVGGAERDQWLFSRALADAGWSVIVGVRSAMNPGERRAIEGVEFVGIGKNNILLALYRFLSSERPNWLFCEGATHLWGLIVEIARRAGVGSMFCAACDLDVQPRYAPLYRPRWWPLYAWGLSRTDRIFVQHAGQLSGLPSRWRSKASVLPKVCVSKSNGGDLLCAKPHAERPKYVAWVGTLIQFKRPDILIELARRAPGIRFVVCGGPSNSTASVYGERVVSELSLAPNIDYLGQVSPTKAQQVIADAAVFLSTSDVEGFPNAFVQAWSSGTPVVSLKIDPDRIIERMGLGVVSGNAERAIGAINVLIESPQHRDEIAARARQFVSENYSATTVVTRFEHALDGVD